MKIKSNMPVPAAALLTIMATAALGGDFDLSWHTIGSGIQSSTGGNLELAGTIGQADAGVLTGGNLQLVGGFWSVLSQPLPPACPWDFDDSGDVGFNDLLAVLSKWGYYDPCPPYIPEDLNRDCEVGFDDLLEVLANWGLCPE